MLHNTALYVHFLYFSKAACVFFCNTEWCISSMLTMEQSQQQYHVNFHMWSKNDLFLSCSKNSALVSSLVQDIRITILA